jgi:hypothetical protein
MQKDPHLQKVQRVRKEKAKYLEKPGSVTPANCNLFHILGHDAYRKIAC